MQWPDPDSAEMGILVDHWLQWLRAQGYGDRALWAKASALGTGISQGGLRPENPARAVQEFLAWSEDQGRGHES